MILALLASLALSVATPAAPSSAGAPPALDCANETALRAAYDKAFGAWRAHEAAAAKTSFELIVQSCGKDRSTWLARTVRSVMALEDNDADTAAGLMGPVPHPLGAHLGALPSFVALRVARAHKDLPAFNRERDALLAASQAGLTDPGKIKGRLIETFSVGEYRVVAFEARFAQASFKRYFQFTIIPPGDYAMPRSISVSTDNVGDLLGGGGAAYFVDAYDCASHATMQVMDHKPTYAQLKTIVTSVLQGRAEAVSGTSAGGFCAWPDFIVPGLED